MNETTPDPTRWYPIRPETCPKCGDHPFEAFLPFQVQRWPYRFLFWWPRLSYAVICVACKEIVGWE